MKFSVSRDNILKPLQQVGVVVERRQTLPILSNVLLVLEGSKLSMTGTDLEVEMVQRRGRREHIVRHYDECHFRRTNMIELYQLQQKRTLSN